MPSRNPAAAEDRTRELFAVGGVLGAWDQVRGPRVYPSPEAGSMPDSEEGISEGRDPDRLTEADRG